MGATWSCPRCDADVLGSECDCMKPNIWATGEVNPDYPEWVEEHIAQLEAENAKLQADIERGTNHNLELLDEVAALKGAAEKYMGDAWHHPNCPRFGGNDFPACNCGFSDLTEALLEDK